MTLIGILPGLGEREERGIMFCTLIEALKMACCMYGFHMNAQLQVTVTISCRHKAFVLYMM
jgi:hypothetical protein